MSEEWFDDYDDNASLDSDGQAFSDYSDGSGLDEGVIPAKNHNRTPPYKVLDKAALTAIQEDAIAQVTGILGCSTTKARALLIFFSWDIEMVLGNLAERGEEEVFKRAGIASLSATPAVPPTGDTTTCGICFCEYPLTETTTMSCGHTYCDSCWHHHMRISITEGMGRRLKCMADRCGVICEEDAVKKVLKEDDTLLEKYTTSLLESYVEDNRRVKWCPSVPHCGHAVKVTGEVHCEVTCDCTQQFCFNCLETPHSPATCSMLRTWLQKIQDGTETMSWLNANTKTCPKCSKPVEKNGGCNLVVCRCGQAFCWLCGQATGRAHTWTVIEGHSCGAYKEEAENKATEAQRSLNRYLHYLTRYEAHLQSLRLEERTRVEIDRKVDEMIAAESSLSSYSWLHDAMQQLFLARRIMSYSYIFAYYMFDGATYADDVSEEQNTINQALFEDKQGQLEIDVERLAKLVESGSAVDIADQRMAIINLSSNINSRIVKMYEVIENDIAGQLASCSLDIAPYKGQRTEGKSAADLLQAAMVAAQGQGSKDAEDKAPAVETIDLTADDDEEEVNRSHRKRTREASKRIKREIKRA